MEIFRSKQKLIYWVVFILVVPSFILLYGSGMTETSHSGPDPVVMTYRGTSYRYGDVHQFYNRLFAATGGPLMFRDTNFRPIFGEELMHAAIALALLDEAKRTGVDVSELEIATYVRATPLFRDVEDKDFDRVLQRAIGTTIPLDTMAEYKEAVRDWLRLQKFLTLLDGSALVTEETAYLLWAQDQSLLTYSRLHVESSPYIATARMALEELPAAKLEERIEAYLAENPNDRSYWTLPRWGIEYILIPFDFESITVPDEEVEAEYEATKARYLDDDGEQKPLEMVRETVRNALVRRQGRERAHKILTDEVEMTLRRAYARAGTDIAPLADIAASKAFQTLGIQTGTRGTDLPLPTQEVTQTDALLGTHSLTMLLERINLEYTTPEKSEEERAELLHRNRSRFRGTETDRAELRPIEGEKGLVLFRIADMVPAEPRKLRDEDGTLDTELRDTVLTRLTEIDAMEQARDEARSLVPMLQKGVTSGLEARLQTQTVPATRAPRALREARVGDVLDPRRAGDGYDILMLTNRYAPGRVVFESTEGEAEDQRRGLMKELTAQSRSMFGTYQPESPMPWGPMILPSDRLRSFLEAALYIDQTLKINLRPHQEEE